MKKKMELHVHTRYSSDSVMALWVLRLMCFLKKIDIIAITDHNCIEGAMKFKNKYQNDEFQVIVGEEIMTSQGEIIGLFLHENIARGMTPDETIDEILRQDGIVYIPHPYDEKRAKTVINIDSIKERKKDITCMEVQNGRNASGVYSLRQEEITKDFGVLGVVGSDAHTAIEIGRNYLIIENFNGKKNFREVLFHSQFRKAACLQKAHFITKCVRALYLIKSGNIKMIWKKVRKLNENHCNMR